MFNGEVKIKYFAFPLVFPFNDENELFLIFVFCILSIISFTLLGLSAPYLIKHVSLAFSILL